MFDGTPMNSNPSAAAISASVRKVSALQALELQANRLIAHREELLTAIRQTVATSTDGVDEGSRGSRAMKKLSAEREEVEAQLRPVLRELSSERAKRGERVAAALMPHIERVAAELVTTIARFDELRRFLSDADDEIFRAGGQAGHPLLLAAKRSAQALGEIEMLSRLMAGGGE